MKEHFEISLRTKPFRLILHSIKRNKTNVFFVSLYVQNRCKIDIIANQIRYKAAFIQNLKT